jgi:DNA polymerase-3 subunit alpha
MDFPDDQRHKLVDYTIEKYGKEQVAQIITFGTMAARGALKDVGRVMDVPLNEVTRLTQLVPAIPGKPITLKQALEEVPDLKRLYESEDTLKQVYDNAILVEGMTRNAGTHAAGVVIADKPLIEYVPLHRLTGTPITEQLNAVTQFEMNHLEAIGLLKMDYLGLSMLTIIRKACELIEQRHGKKYTLDNIPIHEKCIYELLSRGDVAGVFQVEGNGMKNLMLDMKPERFENIVAAISLFRPGPLEYIPTYNRRLHGEEQVKYHHPDLEGALGETYGILVYQEQIMRVARDFAGYSMGEADTIRKAVSKKNAEQLAKHKSKFRAGAEKKGYPGETADAIWADIEFFARYGFNKSHAAIYASITCQTAWLKASYPLEYLTALMTCEAGNTEKIASLIADVKKRGIEVLPPSVNWSEKDFAVDESKAKSDERRAKSTAQPSIRFGLMAIKNVGEGPIEAILEARKKGRFKDISDFAKRVDMGALNKRALEALIKVGALDEFGTRSQLLAGMDTIVGATLQARKAAEIGQGMLFGGLDDATDDTPLVSLPKNAPEIPRKELLMAERELIGTYVSEHPLAASLQHFTDLTNRTSADITEMDNGQPIVVAGMVTHVRPHTSKAGKPMAFSGIEDLTGTIELIVFPKTWEQYQDKIVKDKILVVWGKADVKEGGSPKILVDRVSDSVMKARSVDGDGGAVRQWGSEAVARDEDFGVPPGYAWSGDEALADADDPSAWMPPMPEMPDDWAVRDAELTSAQPAQPISLPTSLKATAYVPKQVNGLAVRDAAQGAAQSAAQSAARDVGLDDIRARLAAKPEVPNVFRGKAVDEDDEETEDRIPETEDRIPETEAKPFLPSTRSEQVLPTFKTPTFQPSNSLLTVVITRCGNSRTDIERLEAAHQVLLSFKGQQRFNIKLKNGGARDALIDFPNDTTRDCAELREKLVELLGADCVV